MHSVNLASIDLNLLLALDALLRERSVTQAAEQMGLSQPAMSRALARLRVLFDDPILVRSGHRMTPTPRALAIATPLRTALESIRATLEPPGEFDPRTARRRFVLSALDTTQAVVLPPLLDAIEREAPGVEVATGPLASAERTFAELESGERDLAIGRFETPPHGIRRADFYRDRVVCLARRDHPRIGKRLTLKRYLAEGHLVAESMASVERPFTIDGLLAGRGLVRRIVCRVENLAIAPFVVARTDLIASGPARTVGRFASGLGVRMFTPPFGMPDLDLHLVWHERYHEDPGHRWLRKTLAALV